MPPARKVRRVLFAAVTAALSVSTTEARRQDSPQTPTFRSAVALATLDVGVVDGRDNPVPNLGPEDFIVLVNGRARKVRAVSPLGVTALGAPAREIRTRDAASNVDAAPDTARAPRVIVFLFDDLSFSGFEGRALVEAAVRFVDRMPAGDLMAALTLSGTGAHVGPTGDRVAVRNALRRFVGQRSDLDATDMNFNIAVVEALAVAGNDVRVLEEIQERECADDPNPRTCSHLVHMAALRRAAETKQRSTNQMAGLLSLLGGLRDAPGDSQLVYLTRGIAAVRGETPVSRLQRLAAAHNVTVYALHQPAPNADLTARSAPVRAGEDRALERVGVDELVGALGGTFLSVVGTADRHFDALGRHLGALYRIGFELEPEDASRDERRVEIKVVRRGLRVRPAKRVLLSSKPDGSAGTGTAASPEDRLEELLSGRFQANAVSIVAKAFVAREARAQGLRLTIAAAARAARPVRAAFVLSGAGGQRIMSAMAPAPIEPKSGEVPLGFTAVVPPGDYVLRLAVLSDAGEAGSLEYRFRARLHQAGVLVLADPLLWAGSAEKPVYAVDSTLATSTGIHARVEIYPGTSAPVESHTLVFQVLSASDRSPVFAMRAPVTTGVDGASARGWLPVTAMETGDYILRTAIERDSAEVGAIEQPFRLEKLAAPPLPLAEAPVPPPQPPLPVADSPPPVEHVAPFDAAAWFDEGGLSAIADAFERAGIRLSARARAGLLNPAQLRPEASTSVEGLLRQAVLALVQQRLDDASAALQALDRRLTASPATLVLAGAVFAARGHDREAVGAWQTAEAAGADDPAIAGGIIDALRRLGLNAEAGARLQDALARWPSNAALAARVR